MSASRRITRRRTALAAPFATLTVAALALSGALGAAAASAAPTSAALPAAVRIAAAAPVAAPITHSAPDAALALSALGTFSTGVFDKSAAEIVTFYDGKLFVVNAQAGAVDVLDASDPTAPSKLFSITGAGVANSVAVRSDGLGIVALESATKTSPGALLFFDANASTPTVLGTVTVGALPDMVSISADGRYAVVANEAEPAADYLSDPEGSISVVALPTTVAAAQQSAVRTADFHAFEAGGSKTLHPDVRVFGPTPEADFPVSRNLEPEYVTIDGATAYVALQENNAVAVVDLATASVTDIWPLGFKDLGAAGNGIDASDKDNAISITTYPGLYGMYMPDSITAYTAAGTTYLVTANEGDAREWGTKVAGTEYVEGVRVKDLGKKSVPPICADSPLKALTADAALGRLNVTTATGLNAAGTCYENLYAFGGRSFSIWTTDGTLVFDSGDDFEQMLAEALPGSFNSNHSATGFDGRSDDKGPEPENLTIGQVDGRTYAFIGFERVGGVAVYDITSPTASPFVTYINNRDFSVNMDGSTDPAGDLARAGDLGPEGLTFVPAAASPTKRPMIAVGNEVSGTTTLFDVATTADAAPVELQILGMNDFHGRLEANAATKEAGAAVLAGAVAQLRTENPNTVFVSAGDNIGASTFTSFSQQDNPTIDALVAAGLEVSAVGNHEFDGGWADLTGRVIPRFGSGDLALGANVYRKGTTTPALQEYAIVERSGVRIAFVGTVTEQTAAMVSPAGIADIEFGDQLTAANRVAGQLRDGNLANGEADVVVLLSHDGSETADCAAIAASDTTYGKLVRGASPAISAIISGHTHQAYACSFPVAGSDVARPVVQSGQYGMNLDRLTLSVDPVSKAVLAASAEVLPLTGASYPADPAVASIVSDAAAQAALLGQKTVGSISADITRAGVNGADRGSESTLGNLVADMQLWSTSNAAFGGTPAQIAIMNPGGIRADLIRSATGAVTYQDVASVQPFGNTLWTMDLTGAQLRSILEEQWQPAGSSRPKLHLGISAGLRYVYDDAAPRGAHVTTMSFQGAPITDTQVFRVATNSFLASGGDNFVTFAAGTNRADSGQIDLVSSVAYFEAHPVVDPAPLGRAVVAGTDWATISLGGAGATVGGTLEVTVTGLKPGQQITAELHSDPIVVTGIPVADASGAVAFTVAIPATLAAGEHTLVVSMIGREPISTPVTVAAAPGTGTAPSVTTPTVTTPTVATPATTQKAATTATKATSSLAATGANLAILIALAVALIALGAYLTRPRPTTRPTA